MFLNGGSNGGMPPHFPVHQPRQGMGFFSRFFKIREQDPDSAETTWAMEDNGSELVLFDLNQAATVTPLLRASSSAALSRLLPAPPRQYGVTVVANVEPTTTQTEARTTEAGQMNARVAPLGIDYPRDVYSLSHIALPFPVTDSLYGREPQPRNQYGISLGTVAARGERGAMVVELDALMRMSSNPFFPYMISRIDRTIAR